MDIFACRREIKCVWGCAYEVAFSTLFLTVCMSNLKVIVPAEQCFAEHGLVV